MPLEIIISQYVQQEAVMGTRLQDQNAGSQGENKTNTVKILPQDQDGKLQVSRQREDSSSNLINLHALSVNTLRILILLIIHHATKLTQALLLLKNTPH